MKQGYGKFTWGDGNSYEGDFVNNNIEGKGTYKWKDGRRYTGLWKDNKMNGYGVLDWPDGKRYDGNYLEDKKHGRGTFYWPNGHKYEGEWAVGKQHGQGYLSKNGQRKLYQWENGKRVRELNMDGEATEQPIDQQEQIADALQSQFYEAQMA